MTEVMQKLLDLQPEIHRVNVEKGFWEEDQQARGEKVMLMITELSEAVEAHRKNNMFLPSSGTILNITYDQWRKDFNGTESEYNQRWINYFEVNCKDTLEDEVADTVIRLLDYTYHWNFTQVSVSYEFTKYDRFSLFILDISSLIIRAYEAESFGTYPRWFTVLDALIKFCELQCIDIVQHVRWKLRYNITRPYKHAKKY